jgi:hypothetical protein
MTYLWFILIFIVHKSFHSLIYCYLLQHCYYSIATTALLLQHCYYCIATTALLLQHCYYSIATTATLLLQHCYYSIATTALLLQPHCYYSIATTALLLQHWYYCIATTALLLQLVVVRSSVYSSSFSFELYNILSVKLRTDSRNGKCAEWAANMPLLRKFGWNGGIFCARKISLVKEWQGQGQGKWVIECTADPIY